MYVPMLPLYVYGVIRTRRWLYFTAANPGIEMGGFFGEKKNEILDLIPLKYKVKTVDVHGLGRVTDIEKIVEENGLKYPFVLKPNVGERGEGVKIIRSRENLEEYLGNDEDLVLQEYVDSDLELGVLYVHFPDEKLGKVTSLSSKKFLSVVGDGKSSVRKLLKGDDRGSVYYDLVCNEFPDKLDYLPFDNEEYIIHKIGNHTKGTQFLDCNHLLSDEIDMVFSSISKNVKGVFYGRYDLKVPSHKDLSKGENIKIFELNGVSSEPGHVYDQKHVFLAYLELGKHWLHIIKVCRQNIKKGVKTTPFLIFFKTIKKHFV